MLPEAEPEHALLDHMWWFALTHSLTRYLDLRHRSVTPTPISNILLQPPSGRIVERDGRRETGDGAESVIPIPASVCESERVSE